ncbi:hypothetical protein NM688_g2502 [Phlebia brevispora]|uniref:Uncharacterized protein n=1 Tax=Phlebia brevispora TaxID=194682 RepID=A0ACC1T8I5_9APHY|nr:hypothetical protein NM688_g2502 [Phlebia brevispora]
MRDAQAYDGDEGEAWRQLDEKLREKDEGEVKNCADDIDALLTFAGLYSAILTAFLVQTYPNLQSNPQQTIVWLLEQNSMQASSYMIHAGYINSTFHVPIPPSDFHASTTDVRINVCWFASLVLSLSTASFGIIVKQWLREYLVIRHTIPQQRVRIRYFRYRGVIKWKLFEIAGALPLILQVALALFFVGLCFFTREVHPAIGRTCLVLVSGWAVFFTFFLIAPILSPRCPFKTRYLRASLQYIRARLRWVSASASALVGILACRFSINNHLQRSPSSSYIRTTQGASDNALPSSDVIPTRQPHGPQDFTIVDAVTTIFSNVKGCDLDEDISSYEEDAICHSYENDLAIFREVDLLLLDDSVLETMRLALRQRPPPGVKVLTLAVTSIQRRLNLLLRGLGSRLQTPAADLRKFVEHGSLSPAARTPLMEILADSLQYHFAQNTVEQWQKHDGEFKWMDDTLALIVGLLPLHNIIPERVTSMFVEMLRPSRSDGSSVGCAVFARHVVISACGCPTTGKWQSWAFASIAQALDTLDPHTLSFIIRWSYLDDPDRTVNEDPGSMGQYDGRTYSRLLDRVKAQETDPQSSTAVVDLDVLVTLVELAAIVLNSVAKTSEQSHHGRVLAAGTQDLLTFIVEALPLIDESNLNIDFTQPRVPSGIGLDRLFMQFFTTPALIYSLLDCLGLHGNFLNTKTSYDTIHDPLTRIRSTHKLSADVTASILDACGQYCEARRRANTLTLIATLRLCFLVINLHTDDDSLVAAWRRVFDKLVTGLEITCPSPGTATGPGTMENDSARETADRSAYLILLAIDNDFEDGKKSYRIGRSDSHLVNVENTDENSRYSQWLESFDVNTSPWIDDFIRVLCCITNNYTDKLQRTFWRVRRLQDMGIPLGSSEAVEGGREVAS